jgi:hypothetical protein
MSITSALLAILLLGFFAVGLVGFLNWRSRIRKTAAGLRIDLPNGDRSWVRALAGMRGAEGRRRS